MTGALPRDPIQALLPTASGAVSDRARAAVTFARLLSSEARGARAGDVAVALDGAQRELGAVEDRHVARACEVLLAQFVGGGPFAPDEPNRRDARAAWSVLALHRSRRPDLPDAPGPDEGRLRVARRLVVGLARVGAEPAVVEWWRARIALARGEAGARERLEDLARRPHGAGTASAVRADAVAQVARAHLAAGAPGLARAWLEEHIDVAAREPHVARLAGWAEAALGRREAAEELLLPLGPCGARLPRALARVRELAPEWGPLLTGRPPARAPRVEVEPIDGRASIGACCFEVVALDPGGSSVRLHSELAPGVRARAEREARRRDGAERIAGSPENAVITTARSWTALATTDGGGRRTPPRGTLSGPTVLASTLHPLRDARGEAIGWVRVECEHLLLPDEERLEATARAWELAALEVARSSASPPAVERGEEGRAEVGRDPRADCLAGLFERTGAKLGRRRWWGFHVVDAAGGELELVASGGAALEHGAPRSDAAALRRALRTGARVFYREAEPGLAVHPDAGSGVVLPVVRAGVRAGGRATERGNPGEVLALLAIESTRRRDFGERDVERWDAALRVEAGAAAPRADWEYEVARFLRWHAASRGSEVLLQSDSRFARRLLPELLLRGRSRGRRLPTFVSGPEGSGKDVVVHWLHFLGCAGERARGGLTRIPCDERASRRVERLVSGDLPARLPTSRHACGGAVSTLLLDHVDRLPAALQRDLAHFLSERRDGREEDGVHWVLTSRFDLERARETGELEPDLHAQLDCLELRVAALRDRRDELPELIRTLAAAAAREEGLTPTVLDDDAVALLWRQSWPLNVRQLGTIVHRLVLSFPGESPTVEQVADACRRAGLEVAARLPSRRPRPEDVRAALDATRRANGALNKTRAARYLGWDPDTLVACMERVPECRVPDGPAPR